MLQVLIGGALTIAGGFLAAWWQTNRADDVARDIRRDERRERGLLELNAAVSKAHAQLDPLYRQAEGGQTPFQYQESIRVMDELARHWESNAVGVIPDQDVVDTYTALAVAVHDGRLVAHHTCHTWQTCNRAIRMRRNDSSVILATS